LTKFQICGILSIVFVSSFFLRGFVAYLRCPACVSSIALLRRLVLPSGSLQVVQKRMVLLLRGAVRRVRGTILVVTEESPPRTSVHIEVCGRLPASLG